MKRFLFLAAVAFATAPAAKAEDAPVRAWVAHEGRLKSLEDRMAALEAKPARPVVSAEAVQDAAYASFRRSVASSTLWRRRGCSCSRVVAKARAEPVKRG